ncbi:hypothetical protein HYU06_04490 [Candidatus Woesearchaeota archaeon]|nr:hypothetical protein [Candidatus Woesearchaeota archaeon]
MNKIIRKDILNILDDAIIVLEKKKLDFLEDLSNHIIHGATLYQDEDSISIAVMMYALYKIFSKKIIIEPKLFTPFLKRARHYLSKNDIDNYRLNISEAFSTISRYDGQLRVYIEEVLSKAKIKKGSNMVEHGLSIAKAAQLMGITQWEMMSYLGKTKIIDAQVPETRARKRLEIVRELFV